jgi:bacterioferritin-associated ferredoxin
MGLRAAILIGLQCGACIASEGTAGPGAGQDMRTRLTDKAISQAVREALAESKENPRRHEADVLSADKYQRFADDVHEAKVPDCLHEDALKRQPARIGPISFSYLYAVPFVILAKVRGKCL